MRPKKDRGILKNKIRLMSNKARELIVLGSRVHKRRMKCGHVSWQPRRKVRCRCCCSAFWSRCCRLLSILRLNGQSVIIAGPLVSLLLLPGFLIIGLETIARLAELVDSLIKEELLESPFFKICGFSFLELTDVLDCSLQNRALVLFTARNNLGELINAFIDGLSSPPFNYVCLVLII